MIRIAINGFGRIGRAAFKIAHENKDVEIVAINDLVPPENLAYMLQFDSVYRVYKHRVTAEKDAITVEGKRVTVTAEKDPTKLPWGKMNVDIVLECTGFFITTEAASAHLTAGAKHVIISAPAKDDETPTFVQGVNHEKFDSSVHVSSNASCTTNCLAPVVEIMYRRFGALKAIASTVHSYTASQALVDGPSKKELREGRAGALNIVPTSTGAAIATTKTVPELAGKFDGISFRVPTPAGSIVDANFVLPKKTTVEEVNTVMTEEAQSERYQGIMNVTKDALVSSDILGMSLISLVDLNMTRVVDGDLVKVVSWYDNEWGYATKLVEQAAHFGKLLK